VRWEQPFSRIVGADREVVVQRSPNYKRYRIDGISKRLTDILGTFPTVLFQPDDSSLVHGSPADRRRFMDRLLSQTTPGYAKALSTLQKVLKQRNRLLKQIQEGQAQQNELVYWDEELAKQAVLICEARQSMVEVITPLVQKHYAELMPEGLPISLHYACSPKEKEHAFLMHLSHQRHKEIQAGTTLYGPHREDIEFFYEDHLASECLSRGQSRGLVLALKLAEVAYIEQTTEIAPMLLLDDIFAEFDALRRERILTLVSNYQSVLTVTDLAGVENHLPKGAEQITL